MCPMCKGNMPSGSMKLCMVNSNLRQFPNVKSGLEISRDQIWRYQKEIRTLTSSGD
jgi:hypothetical protein